MAVASRLGAKSQAVGRDEPQQKEERTHGFFFFFRSLLGSPRPAGQSAAGGGGDECVTVSAVRVRHPGTDVGEERTQRHWVEPPFCQCGVPTEAWMWAVPSVRTCKVDGTDELKKKKKSASLLSRCDAEAPPRFNGGSVEENGGGRSCGYAITTRTST